MATASFAEGMGKRVVDDSRLVIAFAALTGPLPKAGVASLGVLLAVVLMLGGASRRAQALAMLGRWCCHRCCCSATSGARRSSRIGPSPSAGGGRRRRWWRSPARRRRAALIVRRPRLVAPLAVLALPFRVPVPGRRRRPSNLLVPLYFVVAAGALAWICTVAARRRRAAPERGDARAAASPAAGLGGWVQRLLALYVVLYGIQAPTRRTFEVGAAEHGLLLRAVRAADRLLRGLDGTGV